MTGLRTKRRHRAIAQLACAALIGGTGLVACSSSGNSSAKGGGSATTISWAFETPPSMNPLKMIDGFAPFASLAYDPLVYVTGSGQVEPALATKWGFANKAGTIFNLTLRSGVKFSDGTPLTAQGAKKYFDTFLADGQTKFDLSTVTKVEATGPLTLQFTLSSPNPDFPHVLSNAEIPGHLISPKELNSPSLDTQTFGAGPYKLDAGASVTGDHYVFVPNPTYWDTSRKRFKKIVVRNISDPAAVLSALETGQVDIGTGSLGTAEAAKKAGLTVHLAPSFWLGIGLRDTKGAVTKALGDVRVRQALNYAIDRKAIVGALYGTFATPTDGIATPGWPGYSKPPVAMYAYNPTKAKKLMAEAGYANGFSMPLLAASIFDPNNSMINAVAKYWKAIGVNVDITDAQTSQKWSSLFTSKKFPAVIDLNGNGLIAQAQSQLLPDGSRFNPFNASDSQVTAAYQQAVTTFNDADRQAPLEKMSNRVRELAWFVPVAIQGKIVFANSKAPKFNIGPQNGYAQIAQIQP